MKSYRIVLDGAVEASRLPLLDRATVTHAGTVTTIDVPVADQSHLDGVVVMLRERGTSLISVEPLAARARRRAIGTTVIAWIGTLAVSQAPHVVLADALGLGESAVPWLWLGSAGLVAGAAAAWGRARVLLPYFTVLLGVVVVATVVRPVVGGWLPLDGRAELTQALAHTTLFVVVAIALAGVCARVAGSREAALLTAGDVRAPSVSLPGLRQPLSWAVVGTVAAVSLFGAFAAVMVTDGAFGPGAGTRLLALSPLIVACAAFNAVGEEVLYRAGPLSLLLRVVGSGHAVAMTAAWFGLGHYFGSVPSGVPGVVMSGFLGLVLGRAMVATRGLLWPVVIHIAIDLVVFASIAAGS